MGWIRSDLRKNREIAFGLVLVLSLCQCILSALFLVIGSARSLAYTAGTGGRVGSLLMQLCVPIVAITFLIAVIVIFISTGTGLRQRQKDLAMLELQGASDRQVLSYVLGESLLLVLPSSVIAAIVSPLVAPALWNVYVTYLFREQGGGATTVPFSWSNGVASVVAGILVGVVAGMLGTLMTAREIRRVSPLEIVRDDVRTAVTVSRPRRVWGIIFLCLTVVLMVAPVVAIAASRNLRETSDPLSFFNAQIASLVTFIIALALLGRQIISFATKAWMALIPSASAPVWVVRQQSARKSEQRSGITTLLTILLVLYFSSLAADRTRTASISSDGRLNSGSGLFLVLSPALLLAFVGVLASYMISLSQRSRDTTLLEVAGADGHTLNLIAFLEGTVPIITATLLSLVYSLVLCACISLLGMLLTARPFTILFPWEQFLPIVVLLIALGGAAAWASLQNTLRTSVATRLRTAIKE
jgi:putative ABC transport system permease protein